MIFRGNISDSILTGDLQGKTLDDLAAAIESGDTYVNVHTAEHPDGEIRGQLSNTDKENSQAVQVVQIPQIPVKLVSLL